MLAKSKYILIVIACLSLASCSSKNNNKVLEDSNKKEISEVLIKGETTEAQVRAKFGEPKNIHKDKDGRTVWEYADDKTSLNPLNIVPITRNLLGVTGTKKRLFITFDNQRVYDYEFTDEKGLTRRGLLTLDKKTD